jgi:spore germination cell wall hydrolase CwlJ-like protein
LPKLLSEEDYNCLVEAVYYEASTEELIGKIAVANVILNRVKADNFPKTICGVVHDKQVKRRGSVRPVQCAFQYHCQRKTYSKIPKDRLVEVHLASYLAMRTPCSFTAVSTNLIG